MFSVKCLMWIVYILISSLTLNLAENQRLRQHSDFSRHSIVQPVILHARSKREISTTRNENGAHHLEVTMKIPVGDDEYTFDLRLNENLLTSEHVFSYQGINKTVAHTPRKEEIDLCHYSGSVRDKPGSWVAVSTCYGVQGIVFDGERVRYIEPAQGADINFQHYIYDHADLTDAYLKGYVHQVASSSQYYARKDRSTRYKRHTSNVSQIRQPDNTFKRKRYLELVLVANRGLYEANNRSLRTVHRQMQTLANIINSVYSPLNIVIVLVGVEVWNRHDKIRVEKSPIITLFNFMNYFSIKLSRRIPNDNAYLITRENFGPTQGKGFANSICTDISCGIVTNHTKVIGLLAMTLAHEIGHNLGMEHDNTKECRCPARKCIMNRWSTSEIPTHWSSCSINSLKLMFLKGKDYCLRNKPVAKSKSGCLDPQQAATDLREATIEKNERKEINFLRKPAIERIYLK